MLGQPISMLLPQVVGFRLDGELPEGATATDLVLTVTEMLRERGRRLQVRRVLRPRAVDARPRRQGDDRQHVAGVRLDLRDLPGRRRDAALPRVHRSPDRDDRARRRVRARAGDVPRRFLRGPDLLRDPRARPRRRRAQRSPARSARRTGCRWRARRRPSSRRWTSSTRRPRCGWATAETRRSRSPSRPPTPRRGPRRRARPAAAGVTSAPATATAEPGSGDAIGVTLADGTSFELDHGRVVIAAITSCTNTSNPSVMIGAGLLARNALERGLARRPWVKTSLAPGSTVVTDYLERGRPDPVPRRRSSSTSSATAARPASATRARWSRRSRRRSPRATSPSAQSSPATATSRAGSTRTSRPTTSPRRRSSSPTRSPAAWTST